MPNHFIKPAIAIVLICAANASHAGENFSQEVLRTMADLSRNCGMLHPLPESFFERGNRELINFESYASYVERDLSKLRTLNKDAEHSRALIQGKPFADTLGAGLAMIKQNRATIEAGPNREALKIIDSAIFEGSIGVKWMTDPAKYNATFSGASTFYASYEKKRKCPVNR